MGYLDFSYDSWRETYL